MIKNYTPHTITIVKTNGNRLEIPSDGIAKCVEHFFQKERLSSLFGFKFGILAFGEVEGLPKEAMQEDENIYIVSNIVKAAIDADEKFAHCKHNFVTPYNFIRDDDGNIIACRGLAMR